MDGKVKELAIEVLKEIGKMDKIEFKKWLLEDSDDKTYKEKFQDQLRLLGFKYYKSNEDLDEFWEYEEENNKYSLGVFLFNFPIVSLHIFANFDKVVLELSHNKVLKIIKAIVEE